MKMRDYGDRETQYKNQLRRNQQAANHKKKQDIHRETHEAEYPELKKTYKTRAGIREWLERPKEERRKEWRDIASNKTNKLPGTTPGNVYYHTASTPEYRVGENEYISTWYPMTKVYKDGEEIADDEEAHWD